ncbi:MAG: hypothetical protein M3394_06580 [Actinomycetota bacterium]|nr:hypothetical protein [Actinomycetota bacterium]
MSFLSNRPRRRTTVAAIALAGGIFIGYAGAPFAGDGLPADKTAVGGSSLEDIDPNQVKEILSQRMKVSTPADLILGVTLECSIVTRLVTDTNEETAEALGSVDILVTIDGKNVPVQTAGGTGAGDNGEVTFCNRTYQRTVTDQDGDGTIDKEDDYIATKTANAFNWVALNVGDEQAEGGYDNPANGNNIVDIRVVARYTRTHTTRETCKQADLTTTEVNSCSEAYVGKRTIVIEPVHAAVNEQSEPAGAPATTLVPALG